MEKEKIEELRKTLVGATIRIVAMEGEPRYTDRVGIVKSVDDIGQIHGTWGGCAIIPQTDDYVVIKKKAN